MILSEFEGCYCTAMDAKEVWEVRKEVKRMEESLPTLIKETPMIIGSEISRRLSKAKVKLQEVRKERRIKNKETEKIAARVVFESLFTSK